jgi:hypothetical protein
LEEMAFFCSHVSDLRCGKAEEKIQKRAGYFADVSAWIGSAVRAFVNLFDWAVFVR